MSYCVYKHTFPNGKVYIGITSQKPEKRWGNNGRGYFSKKKNGEYSQPRIAHAILKYGWDNIKHEILYENLTKEEAEQKEIELIKEYQSNNRMFGLNIENGGKTIGTISEESKTKMSEAQKNRFSKKENHPMYGKCHSESSRKKMSEAGKERFKNKENHPMYGKHFSKESRKKMSEAHKGEKNHLYGKHISKETKEKLSKAHKGKIISDEQRKKMSEAHKKNGYKPSKECTKKANEAKRKSVCCIETNIVYPSLKSAEYDTGIKYQSISGVCRGKNETAGGYHWKYVDEDERN